MTRGEKFSRTGPAVMGILNVTPDSFSDGGRHDSLDGALRHVELMLADGADIIDIGGCSTRPGGTLATEDEERARVVPILEAVRRAFPHAVISVDTFRHGIAETCWNAGADIINDISGGQFDPAMLPLVGSRRIPYVVTHSPASPELMHRQAHADDIHLTVRAFFERQCRALEAYGEQQVILDPGIGFGKSLEANFALLRDIDRYRVGNRPVLIGVSRKSLIGKRLSPDTPLTDEALENGTTALNAVAVVNGADIIRVHDVRRAVATVRLATAVV